MLRRLCCFATAIVVVAGSPAEATMVKLVGTAMTYIGTCEPSAAVSASPSDFRSPMVVASDEDNILRIYRTNTGGKQIGSVDLNTFLGLDPDDDDQKADLEAAATVGGKVFWLASHSRSGGKGKLRESRWQLFETELGVSGGQVTVKPTAKAPEGLFRALASIRNPNLTASIMPDRDEAEDLRPEQKGLNVEGMAAGADGASVLIGLRNPLGTRDTAIVLRLKNPVGVIENNGDPEFGETALLDLDRRGIRSMEYSPADRAYYIIAGPVNDEAGNLFDLYRWTGQDGSPAARVKGFRDALTGLRDFHPEAMIIAPDGKHIRLLSDDGGMCDKNNMVFRAIELVVE
jgi:hypothetical protein